MNQQFYKYGIVVSILFLVGLIPIINLHFDKTSDSIAENSAIKDAVQIAESIKAFRYLYTSEVVGNVNSRSGILIKHDYNNPKYKSIGGAIPLPATLSMELAKRMSSNEIRIDLYSKFPFPWRKDR